MADICYFIHSHPELAYIMYWRVVVTSKIE